MSTTAESVTMTPLLFSMELLFGVFQNYAERDGDAETLSKSELKELLQAELPGFLEKCTSKEQNIQETAKQLILDLDQDGDGKMNFSEFVIFISAFILTIHGLDPRPCQKTK
ncbi:protein S100-A1-like [Xyrichtys novacula]|uniref:Protein S100 n=1 Tax=Xyrichtys novacula TaxID=13765 RepID=A0AAV1HLA0_XYRNO|nr:protein S100-A1-like [Xyrichtys novacula]